MSTASAVIAKVVRSLEVGDVDLDTLLAPDAVVWHNNDGIDMPARDAFAGGAGLRALVEDLRVAVVQEDAIPGGAVARVEIRGTVRSSGGELCARNCIFVTVADDGRLQRIDEYVDPTFLTQLGSDGQS